MRIEVVNVGHVTGVRDSKCFGVTRTVDLAKGKAQDFHVDEPVYVYFHLPIGATDEDRHRTWATLRHRYSRLGSEVVLVERVEDVPEGAWFIMGTRGASPEAREEVARRGLKQVMDTTCPFVTAQEEAARRLLRDGRSLVFCGLPEYHGIPRLRGIASRFGKKLFVAARRNHVDALPFKRATPVGAILQTTWHMDLARGVVSELVSRFRDVRVIDTSCVDSLGRVPAARELAERNDAVVVLDAGQVAKYLADEMEELGGVATDGAPVNVYRIGGKEELRPEWFAGVERLGIIGGVNVHTGRLEELAEHVRSVAAGGPAA